MVQLDSVYNREEILRQYDSLKKDYENLKMELKSYQKYQSNKYKAIAERNSALEKKLDSISNIVEISKYINSNISNDSLLPMINDMIIGILGVTYSTIYVMEEDKLILKASNICDYNFENYGEEYAEKIRKGEPFIVSCDNSPICNYNNRLNIHSVIGVPIVLADKLIGYIIVQHGLHNFFSSDHMKFITSISHQIAIALENSILYKKVRDASIKDSLLKINNRGHFFELIEDKIRQNPEKDFAIVMLDADNFKRVNDVYGHQFGDRALVMLADTLAKKVDEQDIVARYGGEELIIYIDKVLNRTKVFEKIDFIRKCISENLLEQNGEFVKISASFGISYYDEQHRDLNEVLMIADKMLYCAKNNGKNIVVSI